MRSLYFLIDEHHIVVDINIIKCPFCTLQHTRASKHRRYSLHCNRMPPVLGLSQAPPIARPQTNSWQAGCLARSRLCHPTPPLLAPIHPFPLLKQWHQQSVALCEWSGRFVLASDVPVSRRPFRKVPKKRGEREGRKGSSCSSVLKGFCLGKMAQQTFCSPRTSGWHRVASGWPQWRLWQIISLEYFY